MLKTPARVEVRRGGIRQDSMDAGIRDFGSLTA